MCDEPRFHPDTIADNLDEPDPTMTSQLVPEPAWQASQRERTQSFVNEVREAVGEVSKAGRITVHRRNALGEWDVSTFSPSDVLRAVEDHDL